ncbi:hypothetical protein KEM54_000479 [Ascosphaera aggregata]|nr:hypothetical protein KEM54_000479 [Ascosphaera aggregata]
MSYESQPITPQAFALALKDLDAAMIYGKACEIRNSLRHLQRSNEEMRGYIEEGSDGREVFQEAIAENAVVIERMKERIELCRLEVERRGAKWTDEESDDSSESTAAPPNQTEAAASGATTGENGNAGVEQRQGAIAAEGTRAQANVSLDLRDSTPSMTSITTAPDRGEENDVDDGIYL